MFNREPSLLDHLVTLPVVSSNIINKHCDPLAKGLARKVGNEVLTDKSLRKLEFIVNRQFGSGLGSAFFDPKPLKLPSADAAMRTALLALRNEVVACRGQLETGTFLHRYLGGVLQRLPMVLPAPALVVRPEGQGSVKHDVTCATPSTVKDLPVDYGTVSLRSALRSPTRSLVQYKSVEFGFGYKRTFEDVNPEWRISDPVPASQALAKKLENDMRDELLEPLDEALEASLRAAEQAAARMNAGIN